MSYIDRLGNVLMTLSSFSRPFGLQYRIKIVSRCEIGNFLTRIRFLTKYGLNYKSNLFFF